MTSGPGTAPRRFVPPALLTDLLASGLDAGYAEAAERKAHAARHGGSPRGERTFRVLAVVVAAVLGLLVALGWNQAHLAAPAQAVLHSQLVARAQAAQATAAALDGQVAAAARSVASLQSAALGGNARGRAVQSALEQAEIAAGSVAVTGPGLQVVLGDPSSPDTAAPGGRAGSTPISQVRIISDTDVRDLVNVLWSAGAEAVAVDQVRITPLSAVRSAGDEILVDFQAVSSPYTISAVGDADQLSVAFARSDLAARFATLASGRGVSFRFTTVRSVTLPANVVASPNYASPVPTPPPTPGTTPPPPTPTGASS